MRDNFTEPTKRALAKRVAYLCSNPGCLKLTIGPASSSEDESVCIGEAAHITAAAPGGPRYDASLTIEERRSILNAIWLCSICSKVIDTDEATYPVELLKKWKSEAEKRAHLRAFTNEASIAASLSFNLDEESREYLQSLMQDITDDIEQTTARIHTAASENIHTFIGTNWPDHSIALGFMLSAEEDKPSISLEGVANGTIVDDVRLVSAPGTGKTISLIQLTSALLNIDHTIAIYIPLSEWAISSKELFEFLVHRNAFRTFKPQHFMQLAFYGRLVLVLDGWNELDPLAQKRVRKQLDMLKRDFPILRVVIGTRRQATSIPGTEVQIEPLTKEQQLELAVKYQGAAGEALMEKAWNVPGIRELIAIPLYLTSLLTSIIGNTLPETKEAILSNFIISLENDPDKDDIFQNQLLGCQRDLLIGLAIEANKQAVTSLSDPMARAAITKAINTLQDQKQITNALQPSLVLIALVNTHVIIRSSSDIQSYSFQHQQFQEWFASYYVEHLMLESQQGSKEATKRLRSKVLNWLTWEESIFFACERLSRRDFPGITAVADAIQHALFIDPMLAAEMIYRSTEEVWNHISEPIMDFVNRLNTTGNKDQAVAFMVASGRPDFSEHLWPLISHADRQVYMGLFHIFKPFRPSVLGLSPEVRLLELPESQREEIFSELAYSGGYEGIELVARLAKQEKSSIVVAKTIESLNFRQARRQAEDILKTSSNDVWKLVVQKGYRGQFIDQALTDKYKAIYDTEVQTEQEPSALLEHVLKNPGDFIDIESRIVQLIESAEFPVANEYTQMTVAQAFQAYPQAVSRALVQRLATGLPIPYRLTELVGYAEPIDEGPIPQLALDKNTPNSSAQLAWEIIGPKTVGMLMDEYIRLNDEYASREFRISDEERKEYLRLQDAITTSPLLSFLNAFWPHAVTNAPSRIGLLADLLARHEKKGDRQPFLLSADERNRLTKIIHDWVALLLGSSDNNRLALWKLVQAICRLPLPEFIPDLKAMLERDSSDWKKAKKERARSGNRGAVQSDVSLDCRPQYFEAFTAIGDNTIIDLMKSYLADPHLGFQAAVTLYTLWKRGNSEGKDKRWPDFSEAAERHKRIIMGQRPSAHEFVEPIINAIQQCLTAEADEAMQMHALKLGQITLSMPYGNQDEIIRALLALPQPYSTKLIFITTLATQGETLSSSMLSEAVQELIELEAQETWRKTSREAQDILLDWFKLFVFSEQPLALLDKIDQLIEQERVYEHLDRLLPILVHCPSEANALQILEGLRERKVDIIYNGDWLDTLFDIGTESAMSVLFKAICSDGFQLNRLRLRSYSIPKSIGKAIKKYPMLRNQVLKLYRELFVGPIKACFESVLLETPDVSSFLFILNNMALEGRSFDHRLKMALRILALDERPSADWPGSFEVHSISLADFRKQLFAMLSLEEPQSRLAKTCLAEIEELRQGYGRIEDEPRHPDIEMSELNQYYLFN